MGRRKSKGKKSKGNQKNEALGNEKVLPSYSDSEQARALSPTNIDKKQEDQFKDEFPTNPTVNPSGFRVEEIPTSWEELRTSDHLAASANQSAQFDKLHHYQQLLDVQKALRLIPTRPPSPDSGMVTILEATPAAALKLDSSAATKHGMRQSNLVNFKDLQGGTANARRPKKNFSKKSIEVKLKAPKVVTHSSADFAAEQAILFAAEAGGMRKILKSKQRNKITPSIPTNSPVGISSQSLINEKSDDAKWNDCYVRDVSLKTLNKTQNKEKNLSRSIWDLESNIVNLENLRINEISALKERLGPQTVSQSLNDSLKDAKLIKKISTQGKLIKKVNSERGSTPAQEERSVRKKVKANNSPVDRNQESCSIDDSASTIQTQSSTQSRQYLSVPRTVETNNPNSDETEENDAQ